MCILKPELLLIKNIVSYKKFVQDYIREDTPDNDNDDDASDSYGNDNDDNNYNVMFMIMIIMILR